MPLTPRRSAVVAATAVLLLAPGCSADEPAERDDSEAQSEILQPGRPGEGNETLGPDASVEAAPTVEADVRFMQMMVPHHAQALEMTDLAETRASDDQVVALARRIEGAQGPEITAMTGWLQARGVSVPDDHSHHGDHSGARGGETHAERMPGMLSEGQMDRLAAARGPAFDRLFLAGMIQHHQGAVDMADDEMTDGSDILALELAADIATGQQAEIQRMVAIRRQL
ncbi:DUF305 domain-containing protein [Nocardioides sp. GXQ0305]|uniref:DUF305 domain-containing protein n=1 Tax=Nocardioides sp. GXQ0305 TaxID=3423912 RepID=UPI003D7C92F6